LNRGVQDLAKQSGSKLPVSSKSRMTERRIRTRAGPLIRHVQGLAMIASPRRVAVKK